MSDLIERQAAIKHLTKARMIGDSRPMEDIFSDLPSRAMRAADRMVCDPSSVTRTWEGTGKPCEVME